MEGVAGHAVAFHFAVDLRAAALGMFKLFEHDNTGALAHDETVAVFVIGSRRAMRLVVEVGR